MPRKAKQEARTEACREKGESVYISGMEPRVEEDAGRQRVFSLDHNGHGMTRPRRHGGHQEGLSIEAYQSRGKATHGCAAAAERRGGRRGRAWISRLGKVSFEDLDVQSGKKETLLDWAWRRADWLLLLIRKQWEYVGPACQWLRVVRRYYVVRLDSSCSSSM